MVLKKCKFILDLHNIFYFFLMAAKALAKRKAFGRTVSEIKTDRPGLMVSVYTLCRASSF